MNKAKTPVLIGTVTFVAWFALHLALWVKSGFGPFVPIKVDPTWFWLINTAVAILLAILAFGFAALVVALRARKQETF